MGGQEARTAHDGAGEAALDDGGYYRSAGGRDGCSLHEHGGFN